MGIYLDNAATSFPKPDVVPRAICDYISKIGASPGRGAYRQAREAEQVVAETRAGLGAAVRFLLDEGVEVIRRRERDLVAYALDGLGQLDGVKLCGPRDPDRQVGVISFNLVDLSPTEVAYVLDEYYGIMVRAGLHCAPPPSLQNLLLISLPLTPSIATIA